MSLHNDIMNIPVDKEMVDFLDDHSTKAAYKVGHWDARHAAAELSLKYEELIERLLSHLEDCNADDYVDDIRQEYNL